MNTSFTCTLDDRAVVSISGEDARTLLQGLVTVDMDRLGESGNVFGALLAPQGKIQFDFFIHAQGEEFLIDIDKERLTDFLKRMTMYRLRSKVTLADVSETHHVVVAWGDQTAGPKDARLNEMGARFISAEKAKPTATNNDYHTHRISLGIPEGGKDFVFDDIFPHDAMMDALCGVDFQKGCYVGQEVVSRVQHRATARKRFYLIESASLLPTKNGTVMLGDKAVGSFAFAMGKSALGLLRMDKLEGSDLPLSIDGKEVKTSLPDYFIKFMAEKAS
ncbi:MAG: folate-binding protein [Hyphomicrobiales bacterium]